MSGGVSGGPGVPLRLYRVPKVHRILISFSSGVYIMQNTMVIGGGAGNGQWQVMLSHINELLHQGQEWVGGKVDQTDQTVPTRLQQGDSYKSFSARFVHTKN